MLLWLVIFRCLSQSPIAKFNYYDLIIHYLLIQYLPKTIWLLYCLCSIFIFLFGFSRGGFANTRGGNRGSSYNPNYGSPRGSRGGNNYNDSYRSRGNSSFRGSRASSRGNSGSWTSNSPSTGGYTSMNRNSGSNWLSQGDSNYESRNRYSGNNYLHFKLFTQELL